MLKLALQDLYWAHITSRCFPWDLRAFLKSLCFFLERRLMAVLIQGALYLVEVILWGTNLSTMSFILSLNLHHFSLTEKFTQFCRKSLLNSLASWRNLSQPALENKWIFLGGFLMCRGIIQQSATTASLWDRPGMIWTLSTRLGIFVRTKSNMFRSLVGSRTNWDSENSCINERKYSCRDFREESPLTYILSQHMPGKL